MKTIVYEYIPLKEFASRMGITQRTAREWAHSKEVGKYARRRRDSEKSAIFFNWTLWQQDFERNAVVPFPLRAAK